MIYCTCWDGGAGGNTEIIVPLGPGTSMGTTGSEGALIFNRSKLVNINFVMFTVTLHVALLFQYSDTKHFQKKTSNIDK